MPRRITPQTSLDNLKKEAKRWLKAVRGGDAGARARLDRAFPGAPAAPSLREVQHALAREFELPGWSDVKRALAGGVRRTVHDYDEAAAALVAVFGSGDAEALERLRAHFNIQVSVEDVRAFVWRKVYNVRQRAGRGEEPYLAPEEARDLVAREGGFGGWDALVETVSTGRPAPGLAYQVDRKENCISPRRALQPDEWNVLLGAMREQRLRGLEAGGQMTDALLARVSELHDVTALHLAGSRGVTDDGLRHLARMPQLEELDISGASITDRGLEVLRHLPNLRRVAMYWQSSISDAGVAHLAACDCLESVDLMGSHTGDGLIRALAGKAKLRRLKTGRRVTDAALPLLHEIPVFKTWQGEQPEYSLMEPEARPTQLLLDGPVTNSGLAALAGLDGLFALAFFWHTTALTPDAPAALSALANLGHLGWGGERCDDTSMRHIAALPRLRMLQGQGTVATDEGFEALARSRTLEYLWGRECPNLSGRGFIALSRIPTLRGIGVSCRNVDEAALSRLPEFPSLVELMPMDVADEGFRHVGRCTRLEHLWMMYCRDTTDAATAQIRGLSRLTTYYAGRTKITDRSLAMLSRMDSLERLTFWETADVTDAGVRLLARLPRLRELSLDGLPRVTPNVLSAFSSEVRVSHSP